MKKYEDRKRRRQLKEWHGNPMKFFKDFLGGNLFPFQEEIIRKEIEEHKRRLENECAN